MKKIPMQNDVIVVGGGAAGLMCAGMAAKRGRKVCLIEKMERPARKLMITGKGRCNLTNNCTIEDFLEQVCTNPRFLYSALAAFSPQDTMAFFESNGVPVKTERGNRVFPVSDRAADIVDALVRFAKENGVVFVHASVQVLLFSEGKMTGVDTDQGRWMAEKVVVATGGLSYPGTGSTGEGYGFAQQVGHTIVPPVASLVAVVVKEDWCRDLMGLSLRNCSLRVQSSKGKTVYAELGEMLFTHFGVSGPLVLSASAHMRGNLSAYTMEIDLKPGLSGQQLDARLLRDFAQNANRDFLNALGELLPRKLIPVAVKLSGIAGDCKVNQITKEQRTRFAQLLKAMPLHPKAFRPIQEAVVTAGGVKVSEVHPKTMESKLCKGLFFAGEVLDLDAYTGGYNLQIAFSTGFLAGQSI